MQILPELSDKFGDKDIYVLCIFYISILQAKPHTSISTKN